jgi:methylmalonyl-CoA mutase N-terminal domain/subunit
VNLQLKMSNQNNSEKKRWQEETLNPLLNKHPERKPSFRTTSGTEMPRVAMPSERDFLGEIGFPGEYPFTRGVQPTMYRGRFWTMRQYAGYATAEESNKRYRFLLDQGQTGLSVAFDLPTQIGYDSDDLMAAGEVGKVGVAISSLKDMETLLAGIPLDRVSTSMTINSPAAVLLAMYIAVARRQGVDEPARKKCPTGTRSVSRVTTSARQERQLFRNWHSHSPMLLPMWKPHRKSDWKLINLQINYLFSSRATIIFWRKWRNSAPHGVSGHGW